MTLAFHKIVVFEALLVFRVTRLGEIIHIQLAHERGEVIVLKVPRKDLLCKLVRAVNHEASA